MKFLTWAFLLLAMVALSRAAAAAGTTEAPEKEKTNEKDSTDEPEKEESDSEEEEEEEESSKDAEEKEAGNSTETKGEKHVVKRAFWFFGRRRRFRSRCFNYMRKGGFQKYCLRYMGWNRFRQLCNNYKRRGGYLRYISKPMTWAQAERNCISMGGHLASVRNAYQHKRIQRLILRTTHASKQTWIGGSDAQENGVWLWTDGSTFRFNKWCKGEPNNGAEKQHCLQMNYSDSKCWDDQTCSVRLPSVCSIRK